MDLSASSKLITSALTSLDVPPHEYSDDVEDEIQLCGGKDDCGGATVAAAVSDSQADTAVPGLEPPQLVVPAPPGFTAAAMLAGELGRADAARQGSSSTAQLVLAAISVMKGRKARPDTKRLCNWVHRKYGRSVAEVVSEIDSLCAQGILDKVEYKGSISFRVVSERKLHKRAGRRKSSQNGGQEGGEQKQINEQKKVPGKKPQKKVGGEKFGEKRPAQPLTLNFIVSEQLRPAEGAALSRKEIKLAVEASTRPINKKNVFRDLETILAQEIHLGYLLKINEDEFRLSALENSKTYRGTIAHKVSKRRPKPTHKILDMETGSPDKSNHNKSDEEEDEEEEEEEEKNISDTSSPESKTEDQLKDDLIKEKLISNKLLKMKSKMKTAKIRLKKDKNINSLIKNELRPLETGIDALQEKQSNLNKIKQSIDEVSESNEINSKEDLLAKKLKKKKEAWQISDGKDKPDSENEKILRKNVFVEKFDENGDCLTDDSSLNEHGNKRRTRMKGLSRKRFCRQEKGFVGRVKRMTNQVKSSLGDRPGRLQYKGKLKRSADSLESGGEEETTGRSASRRKKRARKIFDPADWAGQRARVREANGKDQDKIKRRVGKGGKGRTEEFSDGELDSCLYCDQGDMKNEKLISCKDCSTTVHPSCLNNPEDLTDQIYSQPWQCINCKVCYLCQLAGEEALMLFCDSCDRGYHMACHQPPVPARPHGRWECESCAQHTGWVNHASVSPEEQFRAVVPALPPGTPGLWRGHSTPLQFCPLPDLLPSHWQDLPPDPAIPDIADWNPAAIAQYLVQSGIQETHAKVFSDEDVDGAAVLVMQRKDILLGLGLKLGPALKIYNRIRALQTRRTFEF